MSVMDLVAEPCLAASVALLPDLWLRRDRAALGLSCSRSIRLAFPTQEGHRRRCQLPADPFLRDAQRVGQRL